MKKGLSSFVCTEGIALDYWAPEVTDDWLVDNNRGKEYADEMISRLRAYGSPTCVGHIIKAMIGKGGYTGVEVGFFHRISEHLMDEGFSASGRHFEELTLVPAD